MAGSVLLPIAGCSPPYLLQAARGQIELMRARQPVDALLADAGTQPELKRRLAAATAILQFAYTELSLPDNGSYRQYVGLERPYVVWNVFAAPELSLTLRTWCFPIAGCVAYRGYFRESAAREFAARLSERGEDVAVIGASAYSTLGFLRDPLLSTIMQQTEVGLAALLFHELAHQRLYVAGDTVFNESFATLVEQEGVLRWLESRADTAQLCHYQLALERERELHRLLRETRSRLAAIYDSGAPAVHKRAARQAVFAELAARYQQLRAGWSAPPYFDRWFSGTLNNAWLGAFTAYHEQVGQLRVILEGEGGSLQAFYRRAERLARLSRRDRAAVLALITSSSEIAVRDSCQAASG